MPVKKRYNVDELGKIIECKRVQIRRIRQIQTDDHYYTTSRDSLLEHIDVLISQVQELDVARAHGDSQISRLQDEMDNLDKARALAGHRAGLEKLLKLQGKIDELQAEAQEV